MKISTKGRYALRMLLDIAENGGDKFISLTEISERQGISKKYLEQIIPSLNSAGFLVTGRGFQGGYKLSMRPSQYTVADILKATEGSLAPVACLEEDASCDRMRECDTLFVWRGLMDAMEKYLDDVTLQDILNRKKRRNEDYVLL